MQWFLLSNGHVWSNPLNRIQRQKTIQDLLWSLLLHYCNFNHFALCFRQVCFLPLGITDCRTNQSDCCWHNWRCFRTICRGGCRSRPSLFGVSSLSWRPGGQLGSGEIRWRRRSGNCPFPQLSQAEAKVLLFPSSWCHQLSRRIYDVHVHVLGSFCQLVQQEIFLNKLSTRCLFG